MPSDGSLYDIPQGLMFSLPLRADGRGGYEAVQGLELSDYIKAKIAKTRDELLGEREIVKDLLG